MDNPSGPRPVVGSTSTGHITLAAPAIQLTQQLLGTPLHIWATLHEISTYVGVLGVYPDIEPGRGRKSNCKVCLGLPLFPAVKCPEAREV